MVAAAAIASNGVKTLVVTAVATFPTFVDICNSNSNLSVDMALLFDIP